MERAFGNLLSWGFAQALVSSPPERSGMWDQARS
jgi:hypothetical protein